MFARKIKEFCDTIVSTSVDVEERLMSPAPPTRGPLFVEVVEKYF